MKMIWRTTSLIIPILFFVWGPATGGSKRFEEIFVLEDTLRLQLPKEKWSNTVQAFDVGRDGKLWVTLGGRPDKTVVRIYSPTGDVINTIRKKDIGRIRGYPYTFLLDVAFDQKYQVYILESVSGNVAVTDSTGRFLRYFGSKRDHDRDDPNCMGGSTIKIDEQGNIYFGGRCYEEIDICPESRDFCLHKYDSEGRHVKSFFPFEKKLFELTSPPSDRVILDFDQEGNIWCVQEMIYRLSKFSPEGKLIQELPGKSSLYTPLVELLSTKSQLKEQDWRYYRLPYVDNLLTLETGLILLSFSPGTNTGFVVEIYDQEGNILLSDIQTRYRLLGKDNEGFLYFFMPIQDWNRERHPYVRVGRFSFNLPTESRTRRR